LSDPTRRAIIARLPHEKRRGRAGAPVRARPAGLSTHLNALANVTLTDSRTGEAVLRPVIAPRRDAHTAK
jgi:hypothetical protein